MLINSPNISGSLTVTGNSVITGSLTVLGGINATITGSATTASYVEYSNVANKPTLVSGSAQVSFNGITDKPTLVSGSAQVSFNGITDKPTLVSGSSQIIYSGLSGIPSGIVSSSTQITGYNIFATTGSNQFNGSQAITGSLTVTGQVVAQTLNVQQVTSSIVYSSGSNIFGNSLGNTQQFTGSVSVTGSLTVNGVNYLPLTGGTLTGALNGTSASFTNSSGAFIAVTATTTDATGSARLRVSSTGGNINDFSSFSASHPTRANQAWIGGDGNSLTTVLQAGGNEFLRGASTGAATFSSTIDAKTESQFTGTSVNSRILVTAAGVANTVLGFNNSGTTTTGVTNNTGYIGVLQAYPLVLTTDSVERMRITSGGNVGIGNNPSYKLDITNSVAATTSLDPITLRLYNGSDGGSAIYFSNAVSGQSKISFGVESTGAGTDDSYLGFSTGANTALTERMRITSGGTVQIVGSAGTLQVGTNAGDHTTLNYSGGGTTLNTNWASTSALLRLQANSVGMTVTGAGRVGIGVENPDAGLQIAQSGQDDQLTIGSIANNRDHAAFMCSGANKAEILRYQSATRLIIGSSGNISNLDVVPGGTNGVRLSAGNTSWSAYTSDERKKKNFETVPGLEAITQINPVKYHFKTQEDSEAKKLGFTAQNIQPLIPEMVHPNGEKADDGTDILTIIPDYILPVLVKAIQEQQAQIEILKTKIEILEQS